MKSIQHVLWRGALALSLMAVGIGSGLGMSSAEQAAVPACPTATRVLVADQLPGYLPRAHGTTLVVLRRPLTPAG